MSPKIRGTNIDAIEPFVGPYGKLVLMITLGQKTTFPDGVPAVTLAEHDLSALLVALRERETLVTAWRNPVAE